MNVVKRQMMEENTLKTNMIRKYIFVSKIFPTSLQFAFEFYLIWIYAIATALAFHNMRSVSIMYGIFMINIFL